MRNPYKNLTQTAWQFVSLRFVDNERCAV